MLPLAEGMVNTLTSMIFRRLKHEPDQTLYEMIHQCLVVLNYIRKSSATDFTPIEARKPEQLMKVKSNLEKNRNKTRKYPPVEVGSLVRLFRKRKNFEKESQSVWSDTRYEVKEIEDLM